MNHSTLNIRIKYYLHRFHYLIVGGIILASLVTSILLSRNGDDWKIVWPIIGAAISLIYIIEKQQLDEAQLFRQLFTDFNSRYDKMNEGLNRLLDKNEGFTKEDEDLLNDYFNLCGEEYLYYRNGYIYPEVWESWVKGMHYYYSKDSRIGNLWDKELANDSYYGLDLHSEFHLFAIAKLEAPKPSKPLP